MASNQFRPVEVFHSTGKEWRTITSYGGVSSIGKLMRNHRRPAKIRLVYSLKPKKSSETNQHRIRPSTLLSSGLSPTVAPTHARHRLQRCQLFLRPFRPTGVPPSTRIRLQFPQSDFTRITDTFVPEYIFLVGGLRVKIGYQTNAKTISMNSMGISTRRAN